MAPLSPTPSLSHPIAQVSSNVSPRSRRGSMPMRLDQWNGIDSCGVRNVETVIEIAGRESGQATEPHLYHNPEQQVPVNENFSSANQTVGKDRSAQALWKRAATLLRHAKRFVNAAQAEWEPGKTQGLDARKMQYDSLHRYCNITAVDYGSERCRIISTLDNESLDTFLKRTRPRWSAVRWICVSGLSWDVVRLLALKYELHPLSIEDCLHIPQRTKLDTYMNHLYVCLSLHTLSKKKEPVDIPVDNPNKDKVGRPSLTYTIGEAEDVNTIEDGRFSKIKSPFSRLFSRQTLLNHDTTTFISIKTRQSKVTVKNNPSNVYHRTSMMQRHYPPNSRYLRAHALIRHQQIHVEMEQVSIFLTEDGTLITLFQHSGEEILQPILEKLRTEDTLLRTSQDASLLMETVIDHIVDASMPIIEKYRNDIADIEAKVLLRPSTKYTRILHIISGELSLLRRTLSPHIQLINALRSHDDESSFLRLSKELAGHSKVNSIKEPLFVTTPIDQGGVPKSQLLAAAIKSATTKPFKQENDQVTIAHHPVSVSPLAKTYFGDALDHTVAAIESIEVMIGICENTIALSFNMISNEQNESMRALALISLCFLPLTFLTGYFGMNLHIFPALDNGVEYFWSIGVPITLGVMATFTYSVWMGLIRQLLTRVRMRLGQINAVKRKEKDT